MSKYFNLENQKAQNVIQMFYLFWIFNVTKLCRKHGNEIFFVVLEYRFANLLDMAQFFFKYLYMNPDRPGRGNFMYWFVLSTFSESPVPERWCTDTRQAQPPYTCAGFGGWLRLCCLHIIYRRFSEELASSTRCITPQRTYLIKLIWTCTLLTLGVDPI